MVVKLVISVLEKYSGGGKQDDGNKIYKMKAAINMQIGNKKYKALKALLNLVISEAKCVFQMHSRHSTPMSSH